MNAVRTLALAAVAGAGTAANAMHNGTPQGKVIEMLPRADSDGNCAELPKLCVGAAEMSGHPTTITYLCPETTEIPEPFTVHVTVTKTTTVTPTQAEPTGGSTVAPSVDAPAPTLTEEPDITTTIHSTLTQYKTITVVRSSSAATSTTPPVAVPITDYVSATIPSELTPLPTETEETDEPSVTIQTSTPPAVTTTSGYDFPTMSPPVVNGTTTGIFFTTSIANSSLVQPTAGTSYTASVTNSSLVQPTFFFPNATSAHYAVPTLNVENRSSENWKFKSAAGQLGASLMTLATCVTIVALAV